MLNNLRKSNKGFTIIEVMIVLAIAGMIILVVLLAVPALQRSSRNTAIKNDATVLAAGFSEYGSNNDGALPTLLAQAGSKVTIGNPATAGVSTAIAKVGASTTVNVAKATPTAVKYGNLWWNTGKACDGTTNSRAVTIYYYVESNSASTTPKCVDAS